MDPVTLQALGLIVEVISAILPWREVVDAWGRYLDHKSRIAEIDAEILRIQEQAEVAKEYIRAQKEVRLAALEHQRRQFQKRLPLLEAQLQKSSLNQDQLRETLHVLTARLRRASADEAESLYLAIEVVAANLTKQSVNALELLEGEVMLQIQAIRTATSGPSLPTLPPHLLPSPEPPKHSP